MTKRLGDRTVREGATLQDVADRAGVSIATASHVLTGKKHVGRESSARVRQAADAIGYKPNTAARSLRTGQTHTIGLIVPDITNPFFSHLAQAIEARVRAEGYATVLIESGYEAATEAQGLAFLNSRRVDGLVWVLSGSGDLRDQSVTLPTVVLDHAPPEWYAVHANDHAGGRLLAQFAWQAGHDRVAALWGRRSVRAIQERRRGFLDELHPGVSLVLELESPFVMDLPPDVKARLLEQSEKYSLLVCGNDVLAIAAIRAFKEAGRRVPEDISVTGYDDTPFAMVVDPPLTTVAMPTRELGEQAVNQLLAQLRGTSRGPVQLVLPVTLMERASTRRRQ